MKKNHYLFPAIFTQEDRGISIYFPDLPGCLPCADTMEEAVKNAKEALGLHLYGMEEDGDDIPEATKIYDIHVPSGSTLCMIDVFMPIFRENIRNSSVKKTLTIPYWLNAEAERADINFSAVLQAALKKELHITGR